MRFYFGKLNLFAALAFLCGVLTLAAPARAAIDLVGSYGGGGHAVHYAPPYIYIGESLAVAILQEQPSGPPVRVGRIWLDAFAEDFALEGNLLYAALGAQGITIVDVSDPANPEQRGNLETPGFARDLAVSGGALYVADFLGGLHAVDVSNPDSPVLIRTYTFPRPVNGVAVSATHLFVANEYDGVRIFESANPAALAQIGQHPFPGDTNRLAIDGSRLCVGNYWGKFHLVNVINPTNPGVIFSRSTERVIDVKIEGDYAFALTHRFIDVFNLADPAQNPGDGPHERGPRFDHTAWGFSMGAGRAYVGFEGNGPLTVDCSDPSNLAFGLAIPGLADPRAAAVQGSIAYVGDADGRLWVIDVSDPENPAALEEIPVTYGVYDLILDGGLLYAASGAGGVDIFDIAQPEAPVLVQNWHYVYDVPDFGIRTGVNALDISKQGNLLAVAGGIAGVYLLDVSDLNAIQIFAYFRDVQAYLYSYHTFDRAEVDGNFVHTRGRYYDLFNPPQVPPNCEVLSFAGPGRMTRRRSHGIGVQGQWEELGRVLVSDGRLVSSLYRDSIRLESNPRQLPPAYESIIPLERPTGIAADGDWIYAAQIKSSIAMINARDLSASFLAATAYAPGTPTNLCVENGYVYVTSKIGGFLIFRVPNGMDEAGWTTYP